MNARGQTLAIAALLVAAGLAAWSILRQEPPSAASGDDDAPVAAARAALPTDDVDTDSVPAGMVRFPDERLRAAGIRLETAGPARLSALLTLPGEIRLNDDRTAHIVPRVTGVVEAVPADLGQRMRRGEVMVVLASPGVSDLRSALAAAERRLALARTTHEREKRLWQERITAEQDYLQARTALEEAEIAEANARQKLQAIGAAAATAGGNRYELRAPIDGVVLEKHISLGEAVKDDTPVFTLADLSTVWLTFSVPAADLAAVRVGGTVTVRGPGAGEGVNGRVSHVSSLLGEQTRAATARVVLRNPDEVWRPGLFVNVSLPARTVDAAVTVPAEAVQADGDRRTVYVRDADGFRARDVETGVSDGTRTEIRRGLKAGEVVAGAGSFVVRAEFARAAGLQP